MSTKVEQLELGPVRAHKAGAIRRALRAGPWCWPGGPAGLARATVLAGALPSLKPGVALVATEAGPSGALYVYRHDDTTGEISLDPAGSAAVDEAKALLGHSIGALRALPSWSPSKRLQVLDKLVAPGETPDSHAVRGDSLGLAVLLALSSACLGMPVPADLVGLAALDSTGDLRAVGGIEQKLRTLRACAPRVRRFLVSPPDVVRARACLSSLGVEEAAVIEVDSASKAVEVVFGGDLPRRMLESVSGAERPGFVEQLLRRALRPERDLLLSWAPVWRMADGALDSWSGLEPGDRQALRLVHAIAVRHDDAPEAERLGEDWAGFATWVTGLRTIRRVQVLTHLVQQNADRCVPDDAQLDALLARARPSTGESEGWWRLRGAEARRLAVRGRLDHAWEIQLEASEFFLESDKASEMSFQLSALYQLAGFLGTEASLRTVEALHRRTDEAGGLHGDGARYVRLAKARAEVQVGCVTEDTTTALSGLVEQTAAPWFVRGSARVWRARARGWGEDQFEVRYEALVCTLHEPDRRRCGAYRAQWELVSGPESGLAAALEELCRQERGAVASMLGCRPEELDARVNVAGREIGWRFPY